MEKKLLIGKRIKSLRKRLQITQDQLAEKIQLSPKYLSNIERGRENPTLDTLLKLSQALNVEPWEIFFLDSELPSKQGMKDKINQLVNEASDERLRLIVRLLHAAVH